MKGHRINVSFDTEVKDERALTELIRKCALRVLDNENLDFAAEIDVTVVDAETIKGVNKEHRDKDAVTDVLSFPMYEFLNGEPKEALEAEPDTGLVMLGDMLLCYEKAAGQAKEYGHSAERECGYLATHSVLHLLGYDHERNDDDTKLMRQKEEEGLNYLGLKREP